MRPKISSPDCKTVASGSKGNLYTAEIVNNRRAQLFVLQGK